IREMYRQDASAFDSSSVDMLGAEAPKKQSSGCVFRIRREMTSSENRRKKKSLAERIERVSSRIALPDPQQRVLEATRDTFTWVTKHTQTWNEHWQEEGRPQAYEPFPPYAYFQDVFDLLDMQRVNFFEKSRDMMISWACVAYLTLQAMKTPFRGVLMQTQKEDKVVQLIEYAKCLYRNQPNWLQKAFPLDKPIEQQASTRLEFAN